MTRQTTGARPRRDPRTSPAPAAPVRRQEATPQPDLAEPATLLRRADILGHRPRHVLASGPPAPPGPRVQRLIDGNFTSTEKPNTKSEFKKYWKNVLKSEYEAALKTTNKGFKSSLREAQQKFQTRLGNAETYNYPRNWTLAAEALDALVDQVNRVNRVLLEESRPVQGLITGEDKWVEEPIQGEMKGLGVLSGWEVKKGVIDQPNDYVTFFHTTTAGDKISDSQIVLGGGNKEFGPGFYTTGGDLEAAKKIGDEWFKKKQKRADWTILSFSVPKNLLTFISSQHEDLNDFLEYVLTHTSGWPGGGGQPNQGDLDKIDRINQEGKVLIFPDDKSLKVKTTLGDKSWDDYTLSKLGGGSYDLVIGPQQPLYMGNWRQYAFTSGRGLWLINSAVRYEAFDNQE